MTMEQVEQFCLDFKYGMSKWQNLNNKQAKHTSEEEKNTTIISSNCVGYEKEKGISKLD